jgi:hypothetical protein
VATVVIPIPSKDFDPTEVAVSWKVLKRLGHSVVFATPAGREGSADDIMLTGEGLDLWGFLPGLRRLVAFGRMARANADARRGLYGDAARSGVQGPACLAAVGCRRLRWPVAPRRPSCAGNARIPAMSCRRWSPNSLRPACRWRRSAMAFCSPRAAAPPTAGAPSCLAAGPPRSLGRLNARAGRSGASFASETRITTAHMLMDPETLPVSCRCKVRSHAHWPGLKTSSTFPQMLSTVIAE